MILGSYMKRLVMFISGLALCAFLFVGTAFAAPFQNGGFELGVTSPPFVEVHVGDTNITGWAVTAGNVDFIDTYWQAHTGTNSIDLNGNASGTIAQTFDTIAGHQYRVDFWLAANPVGGDVIKTVSVDTTGVGNNPLSYTFNRTGHTISSMGWVQYSYNFTAEGISTTLSFASLESDPSSDYGPALDDVSITDTFTPPVGAPEPGTIMLLLAGLVGIASARKLKG
jgi:choice-of-anchor C domain-containing protein